MDSVGGKLYLVPLTLVTSFVSLAPPVISRLMVWLSKIALSSPMNAFHLTIALPLSAIYQGQLAHDQLIKTQYRVG